MHFRVLIVCLLTSFVAGGCMRDVTIDVKGSEPKIVVRSVTAVGSLFEVYVGRSYNIFADRVNRLDDPLTDAVVTIYENDLMVEVLPYVADNRTYKADYARPSFGNTYRIEVSRPGYPTVTATSIVPPVVPIDEITVEKEARQLNQHDQTGVEISFKDREGNNYYSIVFTSPGGNRPCLYCRDAAIEKISDLDLFEMDFCYDADKFLLSDESFQNQTKQLQTYLDDYYAEPSPPEYASIELQHINYEYFRFLTTKNLNEITQGNPFAEPANVVGNITNGFGIFTVYNRSARRVE